MGIVYGTAGWLLYTAEMRAISDNSEFTWIEESRSKPIGRYDDPNWPGNPVSLVIPPLFHRYIKVLHRLEARYENIGNPLSPEELRILQIPECGELRALVERYRNLKPPRILWRTVADYLGVAYAPAISDDWFRAVIDPGCWPRYVYGPPDCCGLDPEDYAEIAR